MFEVNPNAPAFVVGTDFTASSRAAFDSGIRMAKEQGGRLILVHAVRPLGAPGLEMTRPDTDKTENETTEPVGEGGISGADWVDLARSQGVEASFIARPGLPAAILLEEAERVQAKAVVLGSSGKRGLEKAILGSVASDVRKGTHRPVVVVHGHFEAA
ncbi:MAG: universal stress protein [Candidatus Thermoplasmatota archaeon]